MRMLALLACLLPATAAAEGRLSHAFTLYLGGLKMARMHVEAEWDGTRFSGRSELHMAGLVGFFVSGFYRAEAEGRMEGDSFLPGRFAADTAFRDDRQRVVVTYRDGAPWRVEADPPFRPRPWQVAPEAQAGTLDPFAAALTLIRPVPPRLACNRSVDVFDGRRRVRIVLGAPDWHEGEIRCPGTYVRVAGFPPRTMRKGTEFPFTAIFAPNAAGLAELREVFAPTDFGVAVARRIDG